MANVDTVIHGQPYNPYPTKKRTKCRDKMPLYVQSIPLKDDNGKVIGYRYVNHKQPIKSIK